MTTDARSAQAELWSSDPQGWAKAAEGRIRPLYEHVLDDLDLTGSRLLDAGCGTGLFAGLAAARGARVTGLDAAPGLVALARRRHPAVRFVVDGIETLPFEDGTYDVVTAFNSVLYAGDPHRALGELARVLAPGGRAVVTVGAGPDQAESAVLVRRLAPAADLPDPDRLDLTDPPRARDALLDAGFATVATRDVAFDVTFDSAGDAVAAQLPAGPVVAAVRHAGRDAVEAALRSFFAPRTRADGTVRMGLVFRCHSAVVPHNQSDEKESPT